MGPLDVSDATGAGPRRPDDILDDAATRAPRLDAELARVTAEALAEVARHLSEAGDDDTARSLIRQAAAIELMSPELQHCWGGPFNGQRGRAELIERLLAEVQPRAIVETGTYRGITTRWFAEHFDGPVWSCEKEELYLIQARHRLRDSPNARLELSDSRAFLRRLTPMLEELRPALFYLDAHWERDLPLAEELRIIFAAAPCSVVVIDDFKVPGDPGYNWDDYGPGRVLDASQLVDTIPPDAAIYFPRLPSAEESGARRGCCVIAQGSSGLVDRCELLTRWTLADLLALAPASDQHAEAPPPRDLAPEDDADGQSHDARAARALRQQARELGLQAASRLRDVNVLTGRVGALRGELDALLSQRALLLEQIETLTSLLSASEEARAAASAAAEALERRAERQALALEELTRDRDAKRDLIARLTEPATPPGPGHGAIALPARRAPGPGGEGPRGDPLPAAARALARLSRRAARFIEAGTGTVLARPVRAGRARLGAALTVWGERRRGPQSPRGGRAAADLAAPLDLAYRLALGRPIEPDALAGRLKALAAGVPFAEMFVEIATSQEAGGRAARDAAAPAHSLASTPLAPGLSDGEFLIRGGQLVYGRGLSPREVAFWQNIIGEDAGRRVDFVISMINEHVRKSRAVEQPEQAAYDPSTCLILGTTRMLSKRDWEARRDQLAAARRDATGQSAPPPARRDRAFQHTGAYRVSMIASLYRGGKFIRQFLENITSQSLFEQAELIIIDACSPDGEGEVIREYQRTFPNIVYRRINHRLGIYEAWNLAVEMARGRYLTNTNLDDLRRHDSIALQAAMLDAHDDVDVVYQDFYYSLEPFLSFEQAAAFGFKSELPTVTAHNLLQFNSPHNAPMWRASLHAELGGFDTRYRSAGDWEFWLRCIERGKIFRKINSPHVIYYQNPEGISTRPDTRGVEESNHILGRYSAQLISPVLLRSRRDFRAGLGLGDVGHTAPDNAPYYDVVQGALSRLGAGRSVLPAPSVRDPRGGEDGPIRLLIDGVFFQLARTGIARVWTSLLPRLARAPGLSVLMLDRGGAPDIPGVERIEFPSYTMSYTATDSMLIQEFCDKLAIDVFSSSYFTSALATAQVQMVYDMIPESLGFDVSHRVWKEKQLALSYASHFACISERTRDDLIRCYPGIEPWRIAIAYCGVDTETFNPDAARHLPAFRERHALRRPYFLLVGSREQHQNYKNGKLVFDAVKAGGAADFDLVCVGGERTINAAWLHGMPRGIAIRHLDLSDADLATAYAGAEALVYPSLYEGFGLPVIEAMASGCPVISTRLGSLGEVAGDAALSISGQDPLELRQAMERVRTPRARRGLIDAGLARAGQFRWDASAEMFVALARAARSHRRTHEADEFHRRWSRLRVAQAGVDIGLD